MDSYGPDPKFQFLRDASMRIVPQDGEKSSGEAGKIPEEAGSGNAGAG